ncbi:ABC transporter substrate-binding protein [Halovivax gelatinilyticus]|uniref:ABC transporter substrate-binding protein n=1 Tax=Halovivax gelatinilyticus TaxID=2961597 RepID=UPI0020CA8CB3|nr:ABC transporter substrate-binding protein [Halovivax gelatinilyticus]
MSTAPSDSRLTRRSLLASAAAGGLAVTSGCVREVRNIVRRSPDHNLSLSIATVPEDDDPQATQLAMALEESLQTVGIETDLSFLSRVEFYREILINHNFELFVGRHPGGGDPDFLYESLHSRFSDEWGWQNPFGFTNITFDERLDEQRNANGEDRERAVNDLLLAIGNEQPFTPICRPRELRLADTDAFEGWGRYAFSNRLTYSGLSADEDGSELRGLVTDARPTQNLNPLSVEYRDRQLFVDLIYDSLAAVDDGERTPWLAESWEWDGSTATVRLRSTDWHDGQPVTAADVAFTFELLRDTSLGESDVPSPAPIYRGRATAIDGVDVIDDDELELTAAGEADAAESAFTIPVLPEHVWSDRTEEASITGIDTAEGTTTAVVTDNVPPIGSGLYEFADRSERSSIELTRFDEHFTSRSPELDAPSIETLRFDVVASTGAAVEAIADDHADFTATPINPLVVDDLDVPENASLIEQSSEGMYVVGYNTRISPLGNPYFRQILASLIDKAHLAETVFDGYADPVASPLGEPWIPSALQWRGRDPVTPFVGTDGELNEAAARQSFEDIGYRFDEDGNLLVRN